MRKVIKWEVTDNEPMEIIIPDWIRVKIEVDGTIYIHTMGAEGWGYELTFDDDGSLSEMNKSWNDIEEPRDDG